MTLEEIFSNCYFPSPYGVKNIITPNRNQSHILKKLHSNRKMIHSVMSRQSGKTTCLKAFLIWKILCDRDLNILVVTMKSSEKILQEIKWIMSNMDKNIFVVPQKLADNQAFIKYNNGVCVRHASSTGTTMLREKYDYIWLDEYDFYSDTIQPYLLEWLQDFYKKGSKIIGLTSPFKRGMIQKEFFEKFYIIQKLEAL
jgi:hypothetical protein